MKALIAFTQGEHILALAKEVEKGAKVSGAQTTSAYLESEEFDLTLSQAELIFIGLEKNGEEIIRRTAEKLQSKAQQTPVAIYCIAGRGNDTKLMAEILGAKQIKLIDSISIKPEAKGWLNKGIISETDLVRIEAFGERICNRAQCRQVKQKSEKQRISGYVK